MFTDFREMKGETEKERERGRERQTDIDVRNIDRLPSVCTLSRDWTRNLSMHPDRELTLQPTEPPGQGACFRNPSGALVENHCTRLMSWPQLLVKRDLPKHYCLVDRISESQ